jgi:hypothetical protein
MLLRSASSLLLSASRVPRLICLHRCRSWPPEPHPPLPSSSCRRSPPPAAESTGMDLYAAVGRKEAALSASSDDDTQAVRRTYRHPRPGV